MGRTWGHVPLPVCSFLSRTVTTQDSDCSCHGFLSIRLSPLGAGTEQALMNGSYPRSAGARPGSPEVTLGSASDTGLTPSQKQGQRWEVGPGLKRRGQKPTGRGYACWAWSGARAPRARSPHQRSSAARLTCGERTEPSRLRWSPGVAGAEERSASPQRRSPSPGSLDARSWLQTRSAFPQGREVAPR